MESHPFRGMRLTFRILVALGLATGLLGVGCGKPVRSDPKPAPLAEASGAPIDDAKDNDIDEKELIEFGAADAIPKTTEEKKRYKAASQVSDNLPNSEMSRAEFMKLIDDTESRIPDEAVTTPEKDEPKTETTVVAPVEEKKNETVQPEKKTTGLLTENTPTVRNEPAPVISPKPVVETTPKKEVTPTVTKKPEEKKPVVTTPPPPPVKKVETKPVVVEKKPVPAPVVKKEEKKPVVTTPPAKKETTPTVVKKEEAKPTVAKKETWPKTPPKNPPVVKPVTPSTETPDDGNVADENADDGQDYGEEYTGPSYIVDRPASTSEFHLSETAAKLATMDAMAFRRIQADTLGFPWSKGAKLRECNFFFMTALVESSVVDEKNIPYYQAALFDTKFFAPKGWQKITVAQMKDWFKEGRVFDVAIQRDPPKGSSHGHIAIPIGLTEDGEVMVAQGNHLKYSNKIVKYSDKALAGFRIFARF